LISLGYREQRSGAFGGGVYTFSDGFAESQKRQEENQKKQQAVNEAYQERVRQLGKHHIVYVD